MSSKNSKQDNKIECIQCGIKKDKERKFYKSNSKLYKNVGRIPICKDCLKSMIDYNDMNTIYKVLQQLDIKFDIHYWKKAEESNNDTFGRYITMANSLHQFENTSWKDSIFEYISESGNNQSDSFSFATNNEFKVTPEIIDKWGDGYSYEEYRAFERKYHLLKNNYQEKTAMHTEALLTYIRYRVKEELATAKGDVKAAKEWGQLAQKAAQDAKINPSQLSKSDLSDGLDTFGQLVRSVEQAVDIIPILPKFKERPQDKVDFTIWCYVNYVRDLKGLPLAEYEDIYKFYEERKKEYEERYKDTEDDL
ncbi:hypothetical protein HPK02_10915 [Anoxybacillus flavithermus]|uniref:hypothetical protein n=1 Tax=Anoxybacillus flavithermus TaxID=33934 RepID=UPI0018688123|nr:hypothetical protein [Anoxybacillus flavithermus]MBE2919372.1 hypothetical protein [Anoxybacillus flavithermus]